MGSATEGFFDSQVGVIKSRRIAAKQQARKERANLQARLREDAELRRELRLKLSQLVELVSAHKQWRERKNLRGYVFALGAYESYDSVEYLYLHVQKTAFGRVKYSVGWIRPHLFSSRNYIQPLLWDKYLLETVNGFVEGLRIR